MGRKTKINITAFLGCVAKNIAAWRVLIVIVSLCAGSSLPAAASYIPFNTNVNMNIGIGTETPQASFVVPNGNVGIGTWTAAGGNLIVNGGGNVGIGSAWPGQKLDVNGTVRMTDLTMSGQTPISGYVLTASDSGGDTTWTSPGTVSGWTISGNDVYETLGGNVGIGTTLTTTAALTVLNGNVGIGTWVPAAPLTVGANAFTVNSTGAITATTGITTSGGYSQAGGGINAFTGNVGIGSTAPGQVLDVNGTVRTVGFIMSGQTPVSGFVLTAIDSAGDTTWSSASAVGGWTVSGNNVYETAGGNVGIGTSALQTALAVTNGNVGIGTWTAVNPLSIIGGASIGSTTFTNTPAPVNGLLVSGNVGLGSLAPGQALDVTGTVRTTAFTMSGQTPISGYVLTASDSGGDTTWTSPGTVSGWTISGNNVYETNSGNVGIGTSALQTAFAVTNGNVGIGTWTAVNPLSIIGGASIGSTTFANTLAPVNGLLVSGNVGVGSLAPGQALDITGTLRSLGGIVNGNVGIGTSALQTALAVTNGNVGIGTWTAANSISIVGGASIGSTTFANTLAPVNGLLVSGNVGLGSLTPGTALDVNGTVRTIAFTMSGQTPISGYVLTASDSSGDTTWTSPGTVSGWTISGNNVYETLSGNVGIGTSTVNQGALVVTNGNVGIGTWTTSNNLLNVAGGVGIGTIYAANYAAPADSLIVQNFVGIGTWIPANSSSLAIRNTNASIIMTDNGGFAVQEGIASNAGAFTGYSLAHDAVLRATNGRLILADNAASIVFGNLSNAQMLLDSNGNLGIGSLSPGQALDVNGTVRTTAFTMSGQTPISGYVLTASDSSGDTTWTSPGTVSGWTISGNNVYETAGGNVGIGTSALQTALAVSNGNVGIGTWTAVNPLSIIGGASIGSTTFANTPAPKNGLLVSGNVGLGSSAPGQALDVTGTIRTTAFIMSGQTPISGFVLTAVDSAGDTTWSSASAVGGWSVLGNNVYETAGGNVGIGTSALQTAFAVTNGNVGIGTWTAGNPLSIVGGASIGSTTFANTPAPVNGLLVSGNVGLGSLTPGTALDVNGTARMTGLTLTGNGAANGNVLVSNTLGVGTWMAANTLVTSSQWTTTNVNDVFLSNNGNVGIGTTFTTTSAMTVMNGNVGIGTWKSAGALDIKGGNALVENGNVGIGSLVPGQALDVNGTVRTVAFTMSGQTPISGYVLTASDSSGDTTWTSPGTVSGWTISGNNVYETAGGNVGIGTSALQTAFAVTNGNVGIGTWTAGNPLSIVGGASIGSTTFANTLAPVNGLLVSGNVGLGSLTPGTALDVNGTTRMTGLTLTGNGAANGNVLVGNTLGVGTWMPASTLVTSSQWTTTNVNDVFLSNNGNVGIGTNITNAGAALTVMNGNVGIGTWKPVGALDIKGGNALVESGNVGIGSLTPGQALDVQGIIRDLGEIVNGNVGIGSAAPGQALDVAGTVRTTAFTMSGQTPISGYVLTASDSGGDTTWTSPGAVSGWTISGNNVYETAGGNVGIGSLTPGQALDITGTLRSLGGIVNGNVGIGTSALQTALAVTNGNVGIGTWTTANPLSIIGGTSIGSTTFANTAAPANGLLVSGNVGLGSLAPGQALDITGTLRSLGGIVNGNVGIGTSALQTALAVTNGNVGIGTWTAVNPLSIIGGASIGSAAFVNTAAPANGLLVSGNVGIGSLAPGQALDVTGTVRTIAFTMSGQTPISGYVLTASDSGGDTTWTSPGAVSGWTISGNNVYETAGGNVGIGSLTPGQALDITGTLRSLGGIVNGNVGIGTSALQTALAVTNGNVGIGTWTAAGGNLIVNGGGNVGIGSAWPGVALDVQGTVRALFFVGNGSQLTNLPAGGAAGITNQVQYNSSGNLTGSSNFVFNGNNLGIGTTTPVAQLAVAGNGVGIGTNFNDNYLTTPPPLGGMIVEGNVGIGSLSPGQKLDVNGTVRTTAFTMSGQTPISGYVLTASDSGGDTTWTSPGTVSGWTISGNSVYETAGGNVGIGTSALQTALAVTNGNVGIGTWTAAGGSLIIKGGGNVGIGSAWPGQALDVQGIVRALGEIVNGNVGIGSAAPGQALDVTGTVRTIAFTMSGQTPISGYVLTASDSSGDTTWTSPGTVSGWTISGNNVYETAGGNVGIGTSALQTAFAVTNGNVGIGTWTAVNPLSIVGGASIGSTTYANTPAPVNGLLVSGNVGLGSLTPGTALDVNGTTRMTGFTLTGNGASAGNVMVTNAIGIGTWMPVNSLGASGTNYWLLSASAGNVGVNTMNTVGIGTTSAGAGAGLVVMNGNVGIGTWVPSASLSVNGNVGIGTNGAYLTATPPGGGLIVQSIIGIGTAAPGAGPQPGTALDVVSRVANVDMNVAEFSGNPGINNQVGITINNTTGASNLNAVLNFASNNTVKWQIGNDEADTGGQNFYIWDNTAQSTRFFINQNGNIGIGTWVPAAQLAVAGNGVGIGTNMNTAYLTTTPPLGGMIVQGNVGIGSLTPGQALDVAGTVRTIAFAMSGQTPISGYVLTASDSVGDTTWTSPGTVSGWTISGNNVYETAGGNVGIGTTILTNAALTVMNGNVGIGTWIPAALLDVAGSGNSNFSGNVGIGSTAPGKSLDVNGIARVTGFEMTASAVNGYVLTATDSAGDSAWTSPSIVSGWTITGNNVYETNGGNVGIGTVTSGGGRLIVIGGNVGISSAAPGTALDVQGTTRTTGFTLTGNGVASGNVLVTNGVGVGTWMPASTLSSALATNYWLLNGGTNVGINTTQAVGIGTSFTGGTGEAALSVMNGNVGVGTWIAPNGVSVNGAMAIGTNVTSQAIAPINGLLVAGNVGLGTTSAPNQLTVVGGESIGDNIHSQNSSPANGLYVSGNVGIGTWVPNGALVVNGNVGIGSLAPGATLDVQGTTRTTGLTLTGNGAGSGNVLVSNGIGVGTWMPANTLASALATNYWLLNGGTNVGINTTQAVGIGTSFVGGAGEATLSVMNGNVGIGTWVPASVFQIGQGTSPVLQVSSLGIMGLGTAANTGDSNYILSLGTATGTDASYIGFQGTTQADGVSAIEMDYGSFGTAAWLGYANTPGYFLLQTFNPHGTNGNIILMPYGNVGIGTIAPASKFNVNGSVGIGTSLTDGAYLNGNSAPSGGLIVQGNVGIGTFNPFGGNLIVNGGGNVGIGSLVPGTTLDINGTTRTTGFTLTGNGAASGSILVSNGIGVGTWMASNTLPQGSNYWLLNGGTNVGINTTQAVGIGTSFTGGAGEAALSVMNGNVGIGTWVPNSTLSVAGNSVIGSGAGYLSAVNAVPANGELIQGNVGIGTFYPSSNNLTVGSFSGGGSLGIGTNSNANSVIVNTVPYSFEVQGFYGLAGIFSNSSGRAAVTEYGFGPGSSTVGYVGFDGTNMSIMESNNPGNLVLGETNTEIMRIASGGNVGIGTITPVSKLAIVGNFGIGTNASDAYLTTTAPNGGMIIEGNVGIGSLSPGQKLDVAGTVRTVAFTMSGQTPISGYVLTAGDSGGDTTWTSPGSVSGWTITGNNIYETNNTGNVGIGTITPVAQLSIAGNGVGIGTNMNTSYLTTTPPLGGMIVQGNVGLGTTAPQAKFVVVGGNVGIGTWTAAGGNLIVNGGGNVGIGSAWPGVALDVNGVIRSNVVGGSSTFGGNVGIGSSAPGQALDVEGTSRMTGFILTGNGAASGNVLVTNGVGVGTWMAPSTLGGGSGSVNSGTINQMAYYSAGTAVSSLSVLTTDLTNIGIGTSGPSSLLDVNRKFNVLASGNVGIGSVSPLLPLDIVGNVNLGGVNKVENTNTGGISGPVYFDASGNQQATVGWINSAYTLFPTLQNSLVLANANANPIIFVTNGVEVARITSTGNVGIGTLAPNGKLIVSGGNVGIGSLAPGTTLDVQGTTRTTGFTLSGNGAASGNVLVTNGVGVGTWMPAGTLASALATNYWLLNGGTNVGINTTQAVGIGTSFTGGAGEAALSVMNGNVGIGTWLPSAALDVEVGSNSYFGGNVGISSTAPGEQLDVNGVARMAGFVLSGNGVASGNILVTNGVGVGTWMSPGSIGASGAANYWLLNGGTNVGINTTQAVGIGTSFVGGAGEAALSIMNGNVGIGTWLPGGALSVMNGNAGIGITNPGAYLDVGGNSAPQAYVEVPGGGSLVSIRLGETGADHWDMAMNNPINTKDYTLAYDGAVNFTILSAGNVGLGSSAPGARLDVQGTTRTTGFTLSGNGAAAGNVLVTNGVGVGTWMPASTLASALATNYWLLNGGTNVGINTTQAVGIGTSFTGGAGEAALSVMNGNVGIGTWLPVNTLDVKGGGSYGAYAGLNAAPSNGLLISGNVGIGTIFPNGPLQIRTGTNQNGFFQTKQNLVDGVAFSSINDANSANASLELRGTTVQLSGIGNPSAINFLTNDTLNSQSTLRMVIDTAGNIGIGTSLTSGAGLSVMNGNVGIGTWTAAGGNLIVNGGANVGIGSAWPGQRLDINGTARMTGFTLSGNGAGSGNILVSNGVGIGTWMATNTLPPGSNYWLLNGGTNVGINTTQAVGIGTSFVGGGVEAALSVMNGNVGIGTWVPANSLSVAGNTAIGSGAAYSSIAGPSNGLIVQGNVGVGTFNPFGGGLIVLPASTGNVGIGSLTPGMTLDVQGTTRTTGFALTGNGAGNGNVLVGNGVGVGTWMAPSTLLPGSTNYWLLNGGTNVGINTTQAVGIGTSFTGGAGEAALSVMNGNVGIGTWAPTVPFQLVGIGTTAINGGGMVITNGNVGIGTLSPTSTFQVFSNASVGATAQWGAAGNDIVTAVFTSSPAGAGTNTIALNNNDGAGNKSNQIIFDSAGQGQWYLANDLWSTGANNFGIFNSGANIGFFMDSNSNVGIGTWFVANKFNVNGGVGIGTTLTNSAYITNNAAPSGGLIVQNNVGIGTFNPFGGGLIVLPENTGNVGIGSLAPGQSLDVQGTARMSGNVGIGSSITDSAGSARLTITPTTVEVNLQ